MQKATRPNPTATIDLNFAHYLAARKQVIAAHQVNGIPDYAFSLDQRLRQQLAAMPPVRAILKAVVAFVEPIYKQIMEMEAVAVGPNQYPEIHATTADCARALGIGLPRVFILSHSDPNAWTMATDDTTPSIVLTSALVQACEPLELKQIIGHECGHIHNLHGVYNTAVQLITNPAVKLILSQLAASGVSLGLLRLVYQGLMQGVVLFMMRWSRCAEITCDRTGLICCADLDAGMTSFTRLLTGGEQRLEGMNVKEYLKQISRVQATPVRLYELLQSHPITSKRIEALRLFAQCEVLHSWRPEMRSEQPARTKEDIDQTCEQFIKVWSTGYRPQLED